MRFLLGLCAAALVAACSGASSSELFAGGPAAVAEPSPTDPTEPGDPSDPSDPNEPSPPPSAEKDAGADVAVPEKDAGRDAAKDAAVATCSFDDDCEGDEVCNWRTDTCLAPGPLGAACKRDIECTGGLCNWKLTECSEPAPAGTPCRRNKECASGACNASSTCK
jgi:hypothetical protein